ncbi:TatD family [Dipodascopsis uninucleata]
MSEELSLELWNLGVYDAHCHPTDNYHLMAKYLSFVKIRKLTIMATRLQDQEKVSMAAREFPDRIIPCFGYHPWFTHLLYASDCAPNSKAEHYKKVLTPEPTEEFINLLPEPFSLNEFIAILSRNLASHPHALVGEIGLDRSFRIPNDGWTTSFEETDNDQSGCLSAEDLGENIEAKRDHKGRSRLSRYRVSHLHQIHILEAQLRIAAEYNRSVSVHGVQAHGLLYETFQHLWKRDRPKSKDSRVFDLPNNSLANDGLFPKRICLHSYSGSVDQTKLWLDERKVLSKVYFSFSMVINSRYGDKFKQILKSIPDERILAESDYHRCDFTMQNLLQEVVIYICEVKNWSLEEGIKRLSENWKSFVFDN